jgi:ketosteroid isomerase-like protein
MCENLDLVRSIYAGWERGDLFSSVQWHPDIEYVIADGLDPGTWRGLADVAKAFRDRMSAWEGFRMAAEEYRELDGARILVFVRISGGRGKASGLELAQLHPRAAHVFHVSDGKVTRFVLYSNRDRALADLGLAPDDSPDS